MSETPGRVLRRLLLDHTTMLNLSVKTTDYEAVAAAFLAEMKRAEPSCEFCGGDLTLMCGACRR